MTRRMLAALSIAAALTPVATARASLPVPAGPATSGDFAGRVEIPGGRSLYLECHGVGWPTVIFESGLRGSGDAWNYSVAGGAGTGPFPRVIPYTRACIYDRPGTLRANALQSRSDPVPMPRSTGEVVADLHALLLAAGVQPPYVFVGASTGGLIARQYTSLYPAEVAGLVLVDAISEAVQTLMKPRQFAFYDQVYLQTPNSAAADFPGVEAIDFYRSFAEMRRKPRPPREIPMLVLSSDFGFGTPAGSSRSFSALVNRVWKRAQLYLTRLDSNSKQITAVGSGHQIGLNEPALVARMALRVVAAVRNGKRLAPRPPRRRGRSS